MYFGVEGSRCDSTSSYRTRHELSLVSPLGSTGPEMNAGNQKGSPAGRTPSRHPFELQDLAVVMEVARAGSFRGAAHALGVEPSAVSRRIRTLEDRLGASLFERLRSGVRATDAGRQFHDEVRAILARLDSARAFSPYSNS